MKRDEIIARIQPAIDALVDQLVALAPELVRGQLDAMLGQLAEQPAPKKQRDTKPSKSKERTNTCRKCGAVGFTARTCGKTHNIASAGTPSTSPPPTSKADRFARIEAAARARHAG